MGQLWGLWLAALALVFALALLFYARSVKKRFAKVMEEQRENRELDDKIFRLYNEIEGMLDSFEAYVGEVHDEMESRRGELVAMSRQATTLYMQVMQPDAYPNRPADEPPPRKEDAPQRPPDVIKGPVKEAAPPKDEPKSKLTPRERAELEKLTGKGQKIRFLMGKGFNMGEIAKELHIGKGEIRLILDLDKD